MTGKQWLMVTFAVILNIVIFGALLGDPAPERRAAPTATWTPHPTFTPEPHATATAILMPTVPAAPTVETTPMPTPFVHTVAEGETIESIAQEYGVSAFVLKMVNRLSESDEVQEGQSLIIPATEP